LTIAALAIAALTITSLTVASLTVAALTIAAVITSAVHDGRLWRHAGAAYLRSAIACGKGKRQHGTACSKNEKAFFHASNIPPERQT
jgi:hypothetical protein